jgi:hypothetical protein
MRRSPPFWAMTRLSPAMIALDFVKAFVLIEDPSRAIRLVEQITPEIVASWFDAVGPCALLGTGAVSGHHEHLSRRTWGAPPRGYADIERAGAAGVAAGSIAAPGGRAGASDFIHLPPRAFKLRKRISPAAFGCPCYGRD